MIIIDVKWNIICKGIKYENTQKIEGIQMHTGRVLR